MIFFRHVCLRNPFPLFFLGIPSIHSLPEAGSWEQQYVPPVLHFGCIMLIPSLQLQRKTCLMHRSRGFGRRVVFSKICYNAVIVLSVVLCDCCKPQPMNNCWDWVFFQQWVGNGAASLSAADVHKMWRTPEKRFVGHVCLRNPFPPFLLGIPSIHSLLEAGSWEQQYVPPALHFGCIMPIPSLQLQKEDLSYAEKQRVLSRSCGLQELFEIQWLCSQLCHETAANQWTIVEIELLGTVGRKCGCQPFSCPRSQNVTYCRKEFCSTCLFKQSIHAIPFGNSKHPLPARSRFLRAAVRSTSSALWLHYACKRSHPFVADSGFVAHAEKHRSGQCRVLQGLLGNIAGVVCFVCPFAMSTIAMCRDWAFSNSGLEVGLPAFQLPMFAKCDALLKGDLFDTFV